jgi:hypothetical protein
MSKREEVLIKYKELLELVYEYCVKEEPFTCKHLTRAFKINDRAIIVMRKEGIITKLTKGRKKLYKWNYLSPPTSALVYDFYEAVNRDQQEWLLKRKSLNIDSVVVKNLIEFSKYESNNKPKERRKISILWGLITF